MKRAHALIKRVCDIFYNIEMVFIVGFTIITGLLIIVEIIMRNLGFQGIKWLEELGRFMLICTSLVGSSMAVRENGHVVMDVLYTFLGPRVSYILKAAVYLLCGLFYGWLGYYAFGWMLRLRQIGRTMDSVSVPYWYLWVPVSVSLLTMGLRYFVQVKECVVKLKTHSDTFTEMNTKEM